MIIYNFFKNWYYNVKCTKILDKIYKDENLINNLSSLFGTHFKKDWIGRLYTVINPNIKDGKYNTEDQIFEYDSDGLINTAYVEKKIMEKLNIASNFIHANNLFDLLTYEIKKLDDYDNYLFIIKPITLDDFLNSLKKFSILTGILIIIAIVALIIFL
jgi:hypothetical protein